MGTRLEPRDAVASMQSIVSVTLVLTAWKEPKIYIACNPEAYTLRYLERDISPLHLLIE